MIELDILAAAILATVVCVNIAPAHAQEGMPVQDAYIAPRHREAVAPPTDDYVPQQGSGYYLTQNCGMLPNGYVGPLDCYQLRPTR